MSKRNFIRIGLVGFGNMGMTHAYAVQNLPFYYPGWGVTATVAGVLTTSFEKSRELAGKYQLGTPAESFDELIRRDDIDVIDICSPNHLHYDMICRALDAGKNVLCEKPLCVTPGEAREIARREAESGKVCGTVFNNRFMAPVMRARQLIDEGRLGRLLSFRASYDHNSSTFPGKAPGWKQMGSFGGGVLADLGSHVLDLVYDLCGEYDTVQGLSQIAFDRHGEDWKTDADEAFYMIARMKCGAVGTIVANKLATGANDDLSLTLYGERGSIRYSLTEPEWLYFYDNDRDASPIGGERGFTRIECCGRYPEPGGAFPSPKATVGWLRCHVASMYAYLDAVATGNHFSPSLTDGAYIQLVMDAARRSERLGSRVEVENL